MLNRLRLPKTIKCRPRFFDPDWYLERYTDVAASGMNPLRHYLHYGRAEGRLPCFMTSVWRERDLRWGLLEAGRTTLEAQARDRSGVTSQADQVWAALACAKSAAREGNWSEANSWLWDLKLEEEVLRGFCLPDPALIAIEAALMTGNFSRAQLILKQAQKLFGTSPDLLLAEANTLSIMQGHVLDWDRVLARLYRRAGLGGVTVAKSPRDVAPFDRLHPAQTSHRQFRKGPLVSVIMPAHNAEKTIATALRSLRDQTWHSLEILVVDNGSTDATAKIAHISAQQDHRIRILDGHAEPGTYSARNLGVSEAKGAFITVLDADDWAHPERIAQQARGLTRNSARVACMSHWVRTTSDLRFTRWWREDGLTHPDISSLMIRAEARTALGFWDRARAAADTEYHLRVQTIYGSQAIAEIQPGIPLSFGRVRTQSLTQASETGIGSHLFGARRDYQLAGQRWHQRMQRNGDLPLQQHPSRRPYRIPPALALPAPGDPAPSPETTEWLSETNLYDDTWYMQTYPDLRVRNWDGHLHYVDVGEAEGRDPGPGFSSSAYRMAYGPFEGSALYHYLHEGRAKSLAPLPVFDGHQPIPEPGRHVLFFGHQARTQIFGAERCLLDSLDRAQAAGMTPSVVVPQILNATYLESLRERCHQVYVQPYGWIFGGVPPHPDTVKQLANLIQASRAVEVHQNTVVLDAPLYAAQMAGVPTVVHVHELPAQDPRLCMDLGCTAEELRSHMLRHASRFIANSQAVLDWLDLPEDRVLLLPNLIAPSLRHLPFVPASPLRVALIGSLVAKKGIDDFITVARHCSNAGLTAQFVLIGPMSPDLERMGPLPQNVRHAGYAPDPTSAISQADVVMCLSHFAESFGLTVLEAMAAGRPVICYDQGTPPSLVGQSGAGVVVPQGDTTAAVKALGTLIAHPSRLQAASKAARDRADKLIRQAERAPADDLFCMDQP